jgi:hypothetical protein
LDYLNLASNMLNVSKAIEISTIPNGKQSYIVGEIIETIFLQKELEN